MFATFPVLIGRNFCQVLRFALFRYKVLTGETHSAEFLFQMFRYLQI